MADCPQPDTAVAATGATRRLRGWRAAAVAAGATVFLSAAAWAASPAVAPAPTPAVSTPAALGGEPCGHGMRMGAGSESGPHGAHHGHGGPGGHGAHGAHKPMGAMGMGAHGLLGEGRHLERMLDDVKATEPQRTQIRALASQARADLNALHQQGRQLHDAGLALWAAPQLDEQAIAAHRQKMNALHEQVSARSTQAMLDAARLLQPAQRAEWVQRMQAHQGRWERMKAHFKAHRHTHPGQPAAPASGPVH